MDTNLIRKFFTFMSTDAHIARLKKHIDTLPPLPTSVNKVLEICQTADPSPGDLNRVISLDPVLVGRVLRLVNSAYYGLRQEITSLVHAITMLGINTVKNLVLSSAILNKYRSRSHFKILNGYDFWKHSLCVGVTSKLIARKRHVALNRLEEYFISGLLHDIGKIPLNFLFPDIYTEIIQSSQTLQQPLYTAEKRLLGFSHASCGKLIADHWKLGSIIVDSAAHHHHLQNVSEDSQAVVYTVALADYYVNLSGMGNTGSHHPPVIHENISAFLECRIKDIAAFQDEIENELTKAETFLRVVNESG